MNSVLLWYLIGTGLSLAVCITMYVLTWYTGDDIELKASVVLAGFTVLSWLGALIMVYAIVAHGLEFVDWNKVIIAGRRKNSNSVGKSKT